MTKTHFEHYSYTDAGKRQNDDASFIYYIKENSGARAALFGVADGVGSLLNGGLTARIIQDELDYFAATNADKLAAEDFDEMYNLLYSEVIRINKTLLDKARKENTRYGSTLTLCYAGQKQYLVVQVGDSRAYLYSDGECKQLTVDQTLAQKKRDSGSPLPSDPGELKRLESTLLQCIGDNKDLVPVIYEGKLPDNYIIIACSDGLSNLITPEDFERVLASDENVKTKIEMLGDLARKRGEHDNITAVIFQKELN